MLHSLASVRLSQWRQLSIETILFFALEVARARGDVWVLPNPLDGIIVEEFADGLRRQGERHDEKRGEGQKTHVGSLTEGLVNSIPMAC